MPEQDGWPQMVTGMRVKGTGFGPFFFDGARVDANPNVESRRYALVDIDAQEVQPQALGPKTFAELRDKFVDPEKEKLGAELKRFRDRCTHADTTLNGDGTMTCDLCGLTEPDPFAVTQRQPEDERESTEEGR